MKRPFITLLLLFTCSVAWGAAADMAVTSAGAGDGSGTAGDGVTLDWSNAMTCSQFITDVEGSVEAGDRYFFLGGQTYTSDQDLNTSRSGTALDPIWLIGVASGTTAEPPLPADWAYGTDRPLLDFQSNDDTLVFEDYYMFFNLKAHMSDINGWACDAYGIFWNCYSKNYDNGSRGISGQSESKIVNCEVDGAEGGEGIAVSHYGTIAYNYIHDVGTGVKLSGIGSTGVNNIIDSCTTGIDFDGRRHFISGNVVYNCTTGTGGITDVTVIVNNLLDTCTTGAGATTANKSIWLDYNAFGNCTADVSNVTVGPHSQTSTSTYLPSAGSQDFTLSSNSDCMDNGLQWEGMVTQGSLVGDYSINIGADQDDNSGTRLIDCTIY